MKEEEVRLLWKRFQQLGPDKSGHVDKAVFSESEIYSNIFCKQVNAMYVLIHSAFKCIVTTLMACHGQHK